MILVSILEVSSDLISSLDEVFILLIVTGVVVQVLFSNGERLELVNSVVVMSDLWESEGLFVDIHGVYLHRWLFKARCLDLFFKLHSGLKMFLVQRDGELFQFSVHFVQLFLMLLFFLFLFFGSFLGFLSFLLGLSFGLLLGFSGLLLSLSFSFSLSSFLLSSSFSLGFSSLLFSFGIGLLLSLSSFVDLCGLLSFLLGKGLLFRRFLDELGLLLL